MEQETAKTYGKRKNTAVHKKDSNKNENYVTVPLDLLATELKVYGRPFNMEVDNNQNSG